MLVLCVIILGLLSKFQDKTNKQKKPVCRIRFVVCLGKSVRKHRQVEAAIS